MALRSFTDSDGHAWRVWNVVPQYENRSEDLLTPGLAGGWLCFEDDHEKRRLSPIPDAWESAAPDALEAYCRRAVPVSRRDAMG